MPPPGGRGNFGRGGKQRIGGQEMGWDYDPELEQAIDSKPQDGFPSMEIMPDTNPPTAAERETIASFMRVRERIRRGPLYTVQGSGFRVGKRQKRVPAAARFDPFEGMRSYSLKYKRPERSLPDFSTRKYPTKLMPAELLEVFEPRRKAQSGQVKGKKTSGVVDKLKDINENEEEEGEDEDEGADRAVDAEEEAEEAEEQDDDFVEDDSDMGGDYNAELYFDGGDADEVDVDGGGDDGGDYE